MDAVRALLLHRTGQVFLDGVAPSSTGPVTVPSALPKASPKNERGMAALEDDLLALGCVLAPPLRAALLALPVASFALAGKALHDALAQRVGAHAPHVPLFRGFPDSVPDDGEALYVRRLLVHLFQHPEQPCVLCGKADKVHALSPCGHLVCGACFDGKEYGACPICNRRLTVDDPFLKPRPPEKQDLTWPPPVAKGRLTRLSLGADVDEAARALFARLVGRVSPLSPDDQAALETLTWGYQRRVLAWLPEKVPVKETTAFVFGTLLLDVATANDVFAAAAPHLRTATDVLRVLCVYQGHPADLVAPPKTVGRIERPMRRHVLDTLEGFALANLVEDVQRHAALWKRFAERLHPFEQYWKRPKVALAFAALRRTPLDASTGDKRAFVDALSRTAEASDGLVARKASPAASKKAGAPVDVFVFRSWASRVEAAMRSVAAPTPTLSSTSPSALSSPSSTSAPVAPDPADRLFSLLRQRPGEFLRRFDHVLRTFSSSPARAAALVRALEAAAPKASTPLVLMLCAHLKKRTRPLPRRVFFPRGDVMKAYGTDDRRAPLSADAVAPAVDALEREALRRAKACPPVAAFVLDEGLEDLLVPFAERAASKALVALPRGSTLPLPVGERLRLFVHWMHDENGRVDLDLSAALYDEAWRFTGQCDYTSLVVAGRAAVHSGDLTSAPPPLGASEFIDLDEDKLRALKTRYVVMVVFSYNNVAFDQLPEAFAGHMLLPKGEGFVEGAGRAHLGRANEGKPPVFDPRAVDQRFDLQGEAKIAVPLVLDLVERRMRWVDVKIPPSNEYQSVHRSKGALAHLGKDVTLYFGANDRPTLWHLGCLHAAARASTVHVRGRQGAVTVYERGPDEPELAFFRRLVARDERTAAGKKDRVVLDAREPAYFAGLVDDVPLPKGSTAYALRSRGGAGEGVQRVAAGDLVAELKG